MHYEISDLGGAAALASVMHSLKLYCFPHGKEPPSFGRGPKTFHYGKEMQEFSADARTGTTKLKRVQK